MRWPDWKARDHPRPQSAPARPQPRFAPARRRAAWWQGLLEGQEPVALAWVVILGHAAVLLRLLEEVGVAGHLTTDAHLAALALEQQATLHSTDSDFARFPGLRWRNPLRQ